MTKGACNRGFPSKCAIYTTIKTKKSGVYHRLFCFKERSEWIRTREKACLTTSERHTDVCR